MKATVKRRNKKRLQSMTEAKRHIGKASRSRDKKSRVKKKFNFPVTETLRWVADGEELLRKWGAIKSPGAKRIAGRVAMVLAMLETINELRKM
jgi:hypothetical protein